MSPQRGRECFKEEPRGGVEHGQEMCDRETTTFALTAGLTELPLQFGSVGHRETRTINGKGAVTKPERRRCLSVPQCGHELPQETTEDFQRKPNAGVTERLGREIQPGEMAKIVEGRIAVKHLEHEDLNDRCWFENALAPDMADCLTGFVDHRRREVCGDVLTNLHNNANNPLMHRWPPAHGVVRQPPWCKEAIFSSRPILEQS